MPEFRAMEYPLPWRRLNRRSALAYGVIAAAGAILSRCASQSGATTFATARLYADDVVDAVSGAGASYLASRPAPTPATAAIVSDVLAQLNAAKSALDAAEPTSDARTIILEVITGVETLSPYVAAYLGPAAAVLPIALELLKAFVQGLPPPSAAGPTPPAALHQRAELHRASLRR